MSKIKVKLFMIFAVLFSGLTLHANVIPEQRAVSFENRFAGNYLKLPGGDHLVIISDEAVTTSNDSLESAWYDVGGCSDVELGLFVDDTVHIKYYIDYSSGTFKSETGTGYLTLAVDSIKTVGTTNTGLYKGIILRGAGASGVVNQIPGANWIRWRGYRQSDSETSGYCKAALKTIKP